MRMEPLQFNSRQFSRIFLKKKHKSSVKVEKPLPGVVGGDVEIIETTSQHKTVRDFNNQAHPGSRQISGCRPSPLTTVTLNANKGMILKNHPQNIQISPWIIGARVFFSHCRQQTNWFFLWWLKSPPFLWDSSRPLVQLDPLLCPISVQDGEPSCFGKAGLQCKKKQTIIFLELQFFTQCWKMPKLKWNKWNQIAFWDGKSLQNILRMISIFWQCCSNSGASWQEQPTILFKKTMSRFFPQFLDYVNSSCICPRCSKTQGVSTVFDTTHLVGGHPLGPAQAIDWQDFLLHKAWTKEFGSAKLVMMSFFVFFSN